MTSKVVLYASLVALVMTAVGCGQSEGTLPSPVGDQVNHVNDISRDLLALARRDADAVRDLNADLQNLGGVVAPPLLVKQLVTGLDAALAGLPLDDETAKQLAFQLFVALTARDLSKEQIAELPKETAAILRAAGAAESAIAPVAATVADVHLATAANVSR